MSFNNESEKLKKAMDLIRSYETDIKKLERTIDTKNFLIGRLNSEREELRTRYQELFDVHVRLIDKQTGECQERLKIRKKELDKMEGEQRQAESEKRRLEGELRQIWKEERIPSKLKCTHIFCHKCAQEWFQKSGSKKPVASCPQCRTPYRLGDIKHVNLNC